MTGWRCQVCGVKAWEPCDREKHNVEDRCARESCCAERPYGVEKKATAKTAAA